MTDEKELDYVQHEIRALALSMGPTPAVLSPSQPTGRTEKPRGLWPVPEQSGEGLTILILKSREPANFFVRDSVRMKLRDVACGAVRRSQVNSVLHEKPHYANDGPSRGWKIEGVPKRAWRRIKHRVRSKRVVLSLPTKVLEAAITKGGFRGQHGVSGSRR